MSKFLLSPPYSPVLQERFLCVPACIGMILQRRSLKTIPQATLARYLSLITPKGLANTMDTSVTSDNPNDWGIHPDEKTGDFSGAFEALAIPLAQKFVHWREIPSASICDFMEANIVRNNDIMVGYNYGDVRGTGIKAGHVSLISGIDSGHGTVFMIDPYNAAETAIYIEPLLKGIASFNSGFWVFSQSPGTILTAFV